jgi:hypothetical protein
MRWGWAERLEFWEECTAIMMYDGTLSHAEAARLAWAGLPLPGKAR